ncbi:hypothetical protein FM106_15825 [Brachybacterium faecium]|nr:hypothetical protein FM106_15825 [Brachybacterium faecium]
MSSGFLGICPVPASLPIGRLHAFAARLSTPPPAAPHHCRRRRRSGRREVCGDGEHALPPGCKVVQDARSIFSPGASGGGLGIHRPWSARDGVCPHRGGRGAKNTQDPTGRSGTVVP